MRENVKQVIVIRRDLKMRRGKEIAQGSHASMAFLSHRIQPFLGRKWWKFWQKPVFSEAEIAWMAGSFTKVVLQAKTEEELLEIHQRAAEVGVQSHLITDSGRTEFHGLPTHTAVALGPDLAEKIDQITKDLSLY